MSQTAKKDYLIVRVNAEEKAEFEELAKQTYGFRDTSEFMRYALEYIKAKRPILGKSFAPGSVQA